jgi:hypothetical protein
MNFQNLSQADFSKGWINDCCAGAVAAEIFDLNEPFKESSEEVVIEDKEYVEPQPKAERKTRRSRN